MPTILEAERESARIGVAEAELAADLGRVRFAVFGSAVPPDGSFSPRIADGVVQGYEYNGTLAPPNTTFFGMYDRFRSFGAGSDWDMPLPLAHAARGARPRAPRSTSSRRPTATAATPARRR